MIKKVRNVLIAAASMAVLLAPAQAFALANGNGASNDINNGLCAGTDLNASQTGGCTVDQTAANNKINKILTTIINLFSLVVGVVSVIMIVIGGLKYITSGGEAGNISGAKNTIIYAIVGLVIVALAQFIVHFVLGKVTA